jgi:hypothetical protein
MVTQHGHGEAQINISEISDQTNHKKSFESNAFKTFLGLGLGAKRYNTNSQKCCHTSVN